MAKLAQFVAICSANKKSKYTLIMEMEQAAELISSNQPKGKSKHPGLGYFSAEEWLQFAEMHFRHHLTQKKLIDNYLKQMHL